MSDATLLLLAIGPISAMVKADRQSKGISEEQLARKWNVQPATDATQEVARRTTVSVAMDWSPTVRVECRRTPS